MGGFQNGRLCNRCFERVILAEFSLAIITIYSLLVSYLEVFFFKKKNKCVNNHIWYLFISSLR